MRIIRKIGMSLSLSLINGAHASRYWTMRLRGGTDIQGVRLIIVEDRKVILVSDWYAPGVWTLPGGGVDRNETPEEAAIREAREETGFSVRSIAGEIGTYTGRLG